MAESKLVKLNNSYSVYSIIFIIQYAKRILISDLIVANLFMPSLPGMIPLYLATSFYTKGVFA